MSPLRCDRVGPPAHADRYRLGKYLCRLSVSAQRVQAQPDGRYELPRKTPWRDDSRNVARRSQQLTGRPIAGNLKSLRLKQARLTADVMALRLARTLISLAAWTCVGFSACTDAAQASADNASAEDSDGGSDGGLRDAAKSDATAADVTDVAAGNEADLDAGLDADKDAFDAGEVANDGIASPTDIAATDITATDIAATNVDGTDAAALDEDVAGDVVSGGAEDAAADLTANDSGQEASIDAQDIAADAAADGALVPALVQCQPAPVVCDGSIEDTVRASYRKDSYLLDSDYNEYTDYPTSGGRFHIVLLSAIDGTVSGVTIDGFDTSTLDTAKKPPVEWYHVWPHKLKAGQPFFVQFHSKDAKWDKQTAGKLTVQTDNGVAFDGNFPVAQSPAELTYVTTSADLATLLVHVRNNDAKPHTVSKVVVDGRDVTAATCLPVATLGSGMSGLLQVPLCQPKKLGDAYTVVVELADAPPAVGVGRIIAAFFPIVTWNNTDDCPYPGVNQAHFDKHLAAGIDTLFLNGGNSKCPSYSLDSVVDKAASTKSFHLMASSEYGLGNTIPDTSGIAAFMTGDESDGVVYDEKTGVALPHQKAKAVAKLWDKYPEVATYNGAKTNGNVGAFAGTDDIQGHDFYVAACAPHITAWGIHPPPRAAYDYLRNARNNHMPLPTWLYAQGLSPVTAWKSQPAPQEVLIQAMSVVAAGGKGFMWFQSNMAKSVGFPDSWKAMSTFGRMLRGVRAWLREGDITGLVSASAKADVIVELVRSRNALIVPVINIKPSSGPNDLQCGIYLPVPWVFSPITTDLVATIPDDFAVVEVFEVGAQGPLDVAGVQVKGREVTLQKVALDNSKPVRLFVLAADAQVRKAVEAAMAY